MIGNRNFIRNPRGLNTLAFSSANLVNRGRFFNRPWGSNYPWFRGAWNGWGYWPGFWGGWGAGYGYGLDTAPGLGWPYNGAAMLYDNPYIVPVPLPVPVETPGAVLDTAPSVLPQELDYSQPIPVPDDQTAAETDEEVTVSAKQRMDLARAAYQKGDFAEAQRLCERAIQLLPRDTNLHEFRALCQFAQGKYRDAAATLYAVLGAGPGWTWSTLSTFYTTTESYTKHLRALEGYVGEHPKEPAGHFVLAYHYLVLDQRAAALEQLQQVVRMQPKDKLSAGLIEALQKDSLKRSES
jgi:tetratricopeptide (TPR) repeat protein